MARIALAKRGFPSRRLARALLVLPLVVSSPAWAEPSASELQTARKLFQEASALEQRSAWHEASEKIKEALAIKETPGLHFHLAHCAEQLGELVAAARHYERAEAMIRAGAAAPDVEELLAPARARVLARAPSVTLAFPNGVEGATVEIDGTPISDPAGTPVLLDPGRHAVVARAPGRRDFEMEITLVEGQTRTLEVALAEPQKSTPASAPAPERANEGKPASDTSSFGAREIVLVSEATLTLAGLGTGIGFSIARGSASDRIDQAQRAVDAESPSDPSTSTGCGTNPVPACAELDDALADHERATRLATVGFVAAGVGAGATLLTWLLWPSDHAAVSVRRTPNGASLLVSGSF